MDLAKTTMLMHLSLLTLLVFAGLLRNLGEGVSISHCSDLHAIVFIWSKPLLRNTVFVWRKNQSGQIHQYVIFIKGCKTPKLLAKYYLRYDFTYFLCPINIEMLYIKKITVIESIIIG